MLRRCSSLAPISGWLTCNPRRAVISERPVYVRRPPHITFGGPEVSLPDPGGGTEPSAANPSSWTGTGDASLSDSGPYGALETLLGHSGWRSPQHLPYPGRRLGHLRQRCPFFGAGTLIGVVHPLPVGVLER